MESHSQSSVIAIAIVFALQFSILGQERLGESRRAIDDRTLDAAKACLGATTSIGDKSGLVMCSEAVERLRPYAETGNPVAQASLGIALALGLGAPEEGAKWLYQAAIQGNPGAQLQLAALFNEGVGVPTDLVQAYSWALLAANELNGNAAELLAGIEGGLKQQQKFQGLVLARERDLAATKASEISELPSTEFEPFEECAAAVEKDGELSPETRAICEAAMRWYFPKAEEGDATSQCFLGAALLGMGKVAEGAQWVRHAALQGSPEGQFLFATLLQNGTGVPADLLEARRWASLAGDGAQALRDQINAQLKERQRFESKSPAPSLDGVYIGLWESARFLVSGTVRMVVETRGGKPYIEVFVTGGRFKGGKVELTSLEHAAGGLWKVAFKAKKLEVSGTFHGNTFVGSYKYRRRLKRDDVGQWMLFRE